MNSLEHCEAEQTATLKRILRANANTEFGKIHEFSKINSYDEFKARVPTGDYERHRSFIEREMNGERRIITSEATLSYATTSGSTGRPKFIPVTKSAIKNYQKQLANIFAFSVYKDVPQAYQHKILAITSPATEGYTADKTPFGSTTGQMLQNLSPVVKAKYLLPEAISEITDYRTKYYLIALLSLCDRVSTIVCANPSTILILFQTAVERRKDLLKDFSQGRLSEEIDVSDFLRTYVNRKLARISDEKTTLISRLSKEKLSSADIWPDLKILSCWTGGSCETYLAKIKQAFPAIPIKDPGYLASEIRGSVTLDVNNSAGALAVSDIFYEFKEVETQYNDFLRAHELKVGGKYHIFFTTSYGLYRYQIDDIIEVTGFNGTTPEIVFLQKAEGITSITGEKLCEAQLLEAVKEIENKSQFSFNFFICIANTMKTRYQFYYESSNVVDKNTLASELDQLLSSINCEYACKRASLRLEPLEAIEVKKGAFQRFRDFRIAQGVREGQFKMTYLTQKHEWAQAIEL